MFAVHHGRRLRAVELACNTVAAGNTEWLFAVGAGEQRPWVIDGQIAPATIMTASGSFDHRAIDGAEGAQLMEAFKQMCEQPMGMML